MKSIEFSVPNARVIIEPLDYDNGDRDLRDRLRVATAESGLATWGDWAISWSRPGIGAAYTVADLTHAHRLLLDEYGLTPDWMTS